ncbi:MAG TPA: discoidin domain-containing protein [Candidatus Kapabacteria bacterium]|nr:discoidin domain-containing protein [Candidatus Kapabacteria bacterium]
MVFKNEKVLAILVMVFAMSFTVVVMPLSAVSYWKVVGWEMGDYSGSGIPKLAVLAPQDCNITEPGYGWISILSGNIHLMINQSDPQVNQHSPGESFIYYGQDSSDVPIIYYSYGVPFALGSFPPCAEMIPPTFTLNGNSNDYVEVDNMEQILFSANNAISANNTYYLSIQLADQYGNLSGVEIFDWMMESQSPYNFNKTLYDFRKFCEVKSFQLVQGKYYKVKYAIAPWQETSKLIHIINLLDTTIDTVPVMTSNTAPSGRASAGSIYSTSYEAWRAFDGNDQSEPWSRWISSPGRIPTWLSYEFSQANYITGYYILPELASSTKNRSPRNWTFQGWNGASWIVLDTRANIRNDIEWNPAGLSFKISTPGYYSKYKLDVTVLNGSDATSIRQLKLLTPKEAPVDAVPVMISNTAPSGWAAASSVYSSTYKAWKAFDGDDKSEPWSRWISYPGKLPASLSYEFTAAKKITRYYILPEYAEATKDRSPKNWTLQGWDGITWLILDTRTNVINDVDWNSQGLYFAIPNPGIYKKYRLYITAVNGSDVVSIRQLKLFY